MMTIDDMLSQVAKNTGVAQKSTSDAVENPKTQKFIHIKADTDIKTVSTLNLLLAKEIAHCIECGAQKLGVSVVIAIVNSGGRLVLLEAMDDSFIASIQAAQDKAYTAAALKMPTDVALKEARGGSLDGLTNGNGILLLGGGYPIEINGTMAGAIGVSGGTKEQDMLLAKMGIEYFSKRIKQ